MRHWCSGNINPFQGLALDSISRWRISFLNERISFGRIFGCPLFVLEGLVAATRENFAHDMSVLGPNKKSTGDRVFIISFHSTFSDNHHSAVFSSAA